MTPGSYTKRKLAGWRHGRYSHEYRQALHWRDETWRLWREAYQARHEGASLEETQRLAHQACLASENWAVAMDRFSEWDRLAREASQGRGDEPIQLAGGFAMVAMRAVPKDILEEWNRSA